MGFSRMTLVIGAGASKALHHEFGLGIDLVNEIISRLEHPLLVNLLKNKHGPKLKIKEFTEYLAEYRENAKSPSIDQFISEVNEFPEYKELKNDFNKIALDCICYHILGYEGRLLNPEYESMRSFENTWLDILINWMKETNFFSKKISNRCLKIVTFNYDRTIEYFLCKSFPGYEVQVKQFIEESIIHIYGSIGSIFEESSVTKRVAFGAANDKYENWVTQNMQLQYDERNSELPYTLKSQRYISTLQEENSHFENESWFSDPSDLQVCFFGFAFDYLNCRRLNLTYDKMKKPKYYVNIHPKKYDYGYKFRRDFAERLRTIRTDLKFSYLESNDFIKERLSELNLAIYYLK